MVEITLICDKCGHEETGKNQYTIKNKGWKEIGLKASEGILREYLFCPECSEKLGIADTKKILPEETRSLADKLVDCITEIVARNT